jgi:hypothetical protein
MAERAIDEEKYKRARRLFRLAGYGYEDIITFYGIETWNLLNGYDNEDIEIFHGCVWYKGAYRKLRKWNGLAALAA